MKPITEWSASQRIIVFSLILGFTIGVVGGVRATKAEGICDPSYPYPGCTVIQQRNLEAPTQVKARQNYAKNRWSQPRANNINDVTNDRLRHAYYRALRKLDAKAKGKAETDIAYANDPEYTPDEAMKAGHISWQTFLARTDCIANNGPAASWCLIGGLVSDGTKVISAAQVKCNETVMIGGISTSVGGTIFADILQTSLSAAAVQGASSGVIAAEVGCMSALMYDQIYDHLFGN